MWYCANDFKPEVRFLFVKVVLMVWFGPRC